VQRVPRRVCVNAGCTSSLRPYADTSLKYVTRGVTYGYLPSCRHHRTSTVSVCNASYDDFSALTSASAISIAIERINLDPSLNKSMRFRSRFYSRDAMLARVLAMALVPVCVCLSVSLSQVGVLSKGTDGLICFLLWELLSTLFFLRCVSRKFMYLQCTKIRALPRKLTFSSNAEHQPAPLMWLFVVLHI